MKKIFIGLLPMAICILFCGCGESSASATGISRQNGILPYLSETGVPETTALTTCSTLRPFAEMTTMQQITFAEITRMKAFGIKENDEITPWGMDKETAMEETHITEETTIKETAVKEPQTESPDIEETQIN